MTAGATLTIDVHLTDDEWRATMVADCIEGLTATPKWLSPVWFYDEHGSGLFDQITRLPEYYPTRSERRLLRSHAADIVTATGADTLVELGSGTSDKTTVLLDAMADAGLLERYVPFDVSEETVRAAADQLSQRYVDLGVHAVIGDFHRHLAEIPTDGSRMVAFLGGTIGNLAPHERRHFLADLHGSMTADDHLLLGVDLVKDPAVLVDAYDDAAGVTAAFNRNALAHLNDRLGADFDPEAFDHVARWNAADAWIEMWLVARAAQRVRVEELDLTVAFAAGEGVRTEISAKFTPSRIDRELAEAGFTVVERWREEPGFLLVLCRPTG